MGTHLAHFARHARPGLLRRRNLFLQGLQQVLDALGKCGSDCFGLACRIRPTAAMVQPAARVSRCARQVAAHKGRPVHARRQCSGLCHATGRRFGHQIRLGAELLVEAPMGKACGRHQLGHTHAVVAAFAKQRGRCLHDMRPVVLCLCLAGFMALP
jgi:hypothetical protein